MTDPWHFDGRRAVVTGCSSGIGEATARELTDRGADVVGLDIREPRVSLAQFVPVDMRLPDSMSQAAEQIGGPVHALFNCAGISGGGNDPTEVFTINFLGVRYLTEALIPVMGSGAAIVNIATLMNVGFGLDLRPYLELVSDARGFEEGLAWYREHADFIANDGYGNAKVSVQVYTMVRAVELAPQGIRVNCVAPGITQTPMLEASVLKFGKSFIDTLPIPLGRWATPDEQARVLLFLNSDAASYVTGQTIWCDGGHSAGIITGRVAMPAWPHGTVQARQFGLDPQLT